MRFSGAILPPLVVFALATAAWAETPQISDPLLEGTEATVRPLIPTAKALLFPVSASSSVSEPLTITATSSNPKILVRVKTGNPLLQWVIQHTGDGTAADPSYTRTAVFQLFRDLTPETVGFMSGFAQGGYFDAAETLTTAPGRIFRLADFGAVPGQPLNSFIFQGGATTGTSSGTIGFNFENEFSPAAIFDGRGQIAMANAGYDAVKRGTNGSQFFITDGNVRFLDYKHTIFAQMTHGWALLKDLHNTPRQTTATTGETATSGPDFPRQDQPNKPIRIINSSVIQQYVQDGRTYTDAVLVLSAKAPGTANITLTATNAAGESVERTFAVTAADEDVSLNTRPFLTPLSDATIPVKGQANLGFAAVDLEHDYVSLAQALQSNGVAANPRGASGFVQGNVLGVIANPAYRGTTGAGTPASYVGPLYPAVSATQYEIDYRGSVDGGTRAVDNYSASVVAAGERKETPESVVVHGVPGLALPTTAIAGVPTPGTVVGRFRDADPKGTAADVTAQINWGDGTALQAGTLSADPTRPGATSYQISGSHTYPKAGIYTVVSTVTSAQGLRLRIKSTAVVSTSPLQAVGATVTLAGPTLANNTLATFIDPDSSGLPESYLATVDWGDGLVSPGKVKAAGLNKFAVFGKHSYLNAERASVTVRIHKVGTAATADALAWSTVSFTKLFGQRHLPPFDQAHLVAAVLAVPVDHKVPTGASKQTKVVQGTLGVNAQTYFSYSLQIVNAGTLASKPGKLHFYLSRDKTINLEDVKDTAGVITKPKDIPVQIKDLKEAEFFLPAIQPGASLQYFFERSQYADYRLVPPLNESGTGLNLLVQLDYADPIADHEPIKKIAVEGIIQGITVTPLTLTTRESGTTATFKVNLDKKPTKLVLIPLEIATLGLAEGSLDKSSITFTPENWATPQVVTVTGLRDTPTTGTTYGRDGTKTYQVLVKAAVSEDPIYSGMDGPDVTVANGDRDNNIQISSTAFSITEAAGLNHERQLPIRLALEPTAPVSVVISVSKPAEAELTTGTPDTADPTKRVITFLPRDNTMTPPIELTKTFSVRGKDDGVRDGNTTFTISFQVMSNDKEFDGLSLPPITVTSIDDGTITVAP